MIGGMDPRHIVRTVIIVVKFGQNIVDIFAKHLSLLCN